MHTDLKLKHIAELREAVKDILVGEYELSDIYLTKWLRRNKFDVKKSAAVLRKYKAWDLKVEVDNGNVPHYPEFDEDFPVHECGYDTEGCPVVLVRLGQIKADKYADLKLKNELLLYLINKFEAGMKKAMQDNFNPNDPTDIRVVAVIDMADFSIRKFASKQYIKLVIELIGIFESFYPDLLKAVYVVNVSAKRLVDLLFNMVKPFLDADTISRLNLYGTDINSWKNVVKSLVPHYKSQYPQDFVDLIYDC